MPEFSTPEPISLSIDVEAGDIRIEASDRPNTVVEILPGDPANPQDIEAAEKTLVAEQEGAIRIEGPKWPDEHGRTPELRVRVGLPEGSAVSTRSASGDISAHGRLGNVSIETASGDIELEQVENLSIKTASGDIACTNVDGHANTDSASGSIRLPLVSGAVNVGSASGDVDLGEVAGDVQVSTASGDVRLRESHGSITVQSVSGDVQIGTVHHGRVETGSTSGDITIGIAQGTAAWLELNSMSGDVRSQLDGTDNPSSANATVEVHAGTLSGDITIKRAQ